MGQQKKTWHLAGPTLDPPGYDSGGEDRMTITDAMQYARSEFGFEARGVAALRWSASAMKTVPWAQSWMAFLYIIHRALGDLGGLFTYIYHYKNHYNNHYKNHYSQ